MSTDGSASSSLKKQAGEFEEISANYGFTFDKRDRVFMPTCGSITSFSQTLPVYADKKFIGNIFDHKAINQKIFKDSKINWEPHRIDIGSNKWISHCFT